MHRVLLVLVVLDRGRVLLVRVLNSKLFDFAGADMYR